MIALLAIVLEKIGEAFLGALAGKVTDEVWTRLKGDPAKSALKQALGAAIQRYATSQLRLDLARMLLEQDGFLTLPAVANEVTQLVRFEREPDAELIGRQWKASMDDPPPWCDFTYEAKRLLEYLQVELRSTPVFRPVFDAKSLDAIAASTTASSESLARIEMQLADLAQLLSARFSDLIRTFAEAPFNIREQIRDYTRFIQEKTHDFVGRDFVFDATTRFTDTHTSGYYFIRGDPGIGKSALAAQLVKTNRYIHHFNIRSEGINKTDTFLRNVCAQLIVVYQLQHTFLPPETTQDAGFLSLLLGEVSDKLGSQEKAIIVVDALDEVDTLGLSPGANTLYLPVTLPQGIYVIITTRKIPINLRIDCEWGTLDIDHDSVDNIADIRAYVAQAVSRPGIQAYIATQEIDNELFVDHLVEKSEGNFMYLHYVLPEIEHGYYKDLGLEALPAGLQNYYEDHWRRMRGKDEGIWFRYKLPVIMALTVVKEPVSIDLIADFSGVQERPRIREVLQEWGQFLHDEEVPYEGGLQKRYHVYHTSFHDFIATKEEIEDERVSRIDAHKKIADVLWLELLGDE
jgi:NACHT N-terminal Helical domain 2